MNNKIENSAEEKSQKIGLSDDERKSKASKIKERLTVSRASEDPDSNIKVLPSRGKTRGRKPKNPVSPGVPMGGRRSSGKTAFTNNRNKKPKPAPMKKKSTTPENESTSSSEWVEPVAIATVAINQAALKAQSKKKKKFYDL